MKRRTWEIDIGKPQWRGLLNKLKGDNFWKNLMKLTCMKPDKYAYLRNLQL
jgi:hypothetical protein